LEHLNNQAYDEKKFTIQEFDQLVCRLISIAISIQKNTLTFLQRYVIYFTDKSRTIVWQKFPQHFIKPEFHFFNKKKHSIFTHQYT